MNTQDIYKELREMCHMHHTKDDSDRLACFYCDAADEIERLRVAGDRIAAAYEAETEPQDDRQWAISKAWEEARRG